MIAQRRTICQLTPIAILLANPALLSTASGRPTISQGSPTSTPETRLLTFAASGSGA